MDHNFVMGAILAAFMTGVTLVPVGSAAKEGPGQVGWNAPRSSQSEGCHDMTPEQTLEEARRAYMNAFNAGDADGVADLHTEDAIHLPAGMPPVEGRSAIRELVESSLSRMPPEASFRFEPLEVRIADGWAVERGVTEGAESFPPGKYVMLYEEGGDGRWRIAWSITNTDAPPSARE